MSNPRLRLRFGGTVRAGWYQVSDSTGKYSSIIKASIVNNKLIYSFDEPVNPQIERAMALRSEEELARMLQRDAPQEMR